MDMLFESKKTSNSYGIFKRDEWVTWTPDKVTVSSSTDEVPDVANKKCIRYFGGETFLQTSFERSRRKSDDIIRSIVGCWVVRLRYGWNRHKIVMAGVVLLC